jgi:hypothetical protein
MNRYIHGNRNASQDEIEKMRKRFSLTIDKVHSVFGNTAFRRINPDGTLEGNRISRSIMDIIMVSFEHGDKGKLMSKKDAIVDLLKTLPQEDPEFNSALTAGTSDRKQLEYRLAVWNLALRDTIS